MGEVPADLWAEALIPVTALERTTVHGDVSDGQFMIDERLHVIGVVDWDGLHSGHPFLDLDFGVGGYRICRWKQRWLEMRPRIWEAYASESGIPLPEWRCVNLFWCLLDAMTLLRSERLDARFGTTLAALSEATGALQ
jgi:aminoglycoside phosphotransferase (APT) family kinase protein